MGYTIDYGKTIVQWIFPTLVSYLLTGSEVSSGT